MLKLLKYELLQTYRNYSLIFLVFLGLCFINPFIANFSEVAGIIQVSIIILVAIIYCLMFYNIIKNYNDSMFSEKGYLTLTLPVSSHKIVLSKLFSTLIWFFIANIIIFIGMFITLSMLFTNIGIAEQLWQMYDAFVEIIRTIITFEGFMRLLVIISSLICGILEAYMFITLVQTKYTRNHKVICAIILFVAYETIINYVVGDVLNIVPTNQIFESYSTVGMLFNGILYNIVFGGLYYFVTIYIIDNMIEI